MTPDEKRQKQCEDFVRHIITYIDYWDRNPQSGNQRDRLEGLAFSILVTLDGCSGQHPGYALTPNRNGGMNRDQHLHDLLHPLLDKWRSERAKS